MRLLIVTQKVDRKDPILGFFHGWLRAFSLQFGRVIAVGQQVGSHDLPKNVDVYSLGKERGLTRIRQVFRFWKIVWRFRNDYDAVLVHMTPVWVVLGGSLWLLFRKPVYLWYEARGGGVSLRIASLFVKKVFSASSVAARVSHKKHVVTGHGIDTDTFNSKNAKRDPAQLLTVGRITASKRIPIILRCLQALSPEHRLKIVGKTITREDDQLIRNIRIFCEAENIIDRIDIQAMEPEDVAQALRQASIFLHASETALDKALLEAMAAGCIVVSCSEVAADLLPAHLVTLPDGKAMAEIVQKVMSLSEADQDALREELREKVEREHGLNRLAVRLREEMEG